MKRRTRILQSHKAFPEDGIYMAGWCILALAAFLILIKNIFFPGFLVLEHMRPCLLYSLTGFFCPGCGGTRSAVALVHGHFLVCAVDYPLMAYSVVMYLWFMVSQTVERISRGKISIGMKWHNYYILIAVIILAAHFVGKNIFYIVTGMQPFLS